MRYTKVLSQKNPYYISKNRQKELQYFCLQYNEWKRELEKISFIYGSVDLSTRSNDISDIVYKAAEKREKYLDNIKLIEKCCKETNNTFWHYILIGVTTDVNYENLRLVHNIPCCRNYYYEMRRKFFYILSIYR